MTNNTIYKFLKDNAFMLNKYKVVNKLYLLSLPSKSNKLIT